MEDVKTVAENTEHTESAQNAQPGNAVRSRLAVVEVMITNTEPEPTTEE